MSRYVRMGNEEKGPVRMQSRLGRDFLKVFNRQYFSVGVIAGCLALIACTGRFETLQNLGSQELSSSATSCSVGQSYFNGLCQPTQQSCTVPNGVGTSAFTNGSYGVCAAVSCNSGYSLQSGSCVANGPSAPPAAIVAGYATRAFYENFATAMAVDSKNTKAAGYSFYPFTFYGAPAMAPSEMLLTGGHLVLGGKNGSYGAGIVTAHPANNAQGYEGQVFGGGAYFEATLSFDATKVANSSWWPSWWANPIEGLAGKGANQWPGQATGFTHSVELDFFEYDTSGFRGMNTFAGTLHEWYGPLPGPSEVNNGGNGSSFNNNLITVPITTDFSKPHKYGCLWVPYNATTKAPGYVQMWFDGQPTGDKVTWVGTPGNPTPINQPWAFSQTDQGHYAPILGTGDNDPMTVYEVQVWQH